MSQQPTDPPQGVEAVYAGWLLTKCVDIAGRLRDLADKVDREASHVANVPRPGRATYAGVVSRVQHDILWGVANLNLDGLTETAQQADEYRTRARGAEEIAQAIGAAGTLDGERWQDKAARIARDYGKEG